MRIDEVLAAPGLKVQADVVVTQPADPDAKPRPAVAISYRDARGLSLAQLRDHLRSYDPAANVTGLSLG